MTPEQFCYWLRGFFEITEVGADPKKTTLNIKQVEMINLHLESVFTQTIMVEQPQPVPHNFPPVTYCSSDNSGTELTHGNEVICSSFTKDKL